MTNEEIIRRLESVTLPNIALEGHRRELRAALLREYSQVQTRPWRRGLFGWLQLRPPLWRTVLITSAAWVLVALIVILSVLIPMYRPQSMAALAVNTVLTSQEVKAVLANDEMATVTVTDIGNHRLEVVVESRGGSIIIAQVDTRNNTLIIKEITYIILLGSPYEAEEHITGEEQEKVINLASTDRTFRELLDKGAIIGKTTAVYCIVATRHLDIGETSESKERWAMVQLELQGKRWVFLVDTQSGRVINKTRNTM